MPYLSIYGYFNGPEVNRVLFSFHRMNGLLRYIKKESEINKIAKRSISTSIDDQVIIKKLSLPEEYIAIALGGEWSYRTYNNLPKVVERLLINNSQLNIGKFSSSNIWYCANQFTFN